MSVCHWICEGIGVRCDSIYPYLNKERCLAEIKKLFPEEEDVQYLSVDEFDIEDFMYGTPFSNMGEFLSELDDSGSCSYGDNGDGESYFYYTPKYPWQITERDPKTLYEARALIKKIVQRVFDIDDEVIEKLIDNDIYEYGWG